MKHLTVRERIIYSFGAIVGFMVVMGYIAANRLEHIDQQADLMQRDSVPGLYHSSQIALELLNHYSLIEKHILLSDKAAMEVVEKQLQDSKATLEGMLKSYEGTITTAKDRETFEALKASLPNYFRIQQDVIKLSLEQKDAEAHTVILNQLDPQFQKTEEVAHSLADLNKRNGDESSIKIMAAVKSARLGIMSSFVTALLIAIISGFSLFQAYTKPMGRLVTAIDVIRGETCHQS